MELLYTLTPEALEHQRHERESKKVSREQRSQEGKSTRVLLEESREDEGANRLRGVRWVMSKKLQKLTR